MSEQKSKTIIGFRKWEQDIEVTGIYQGMRSLDNVNFQMLIEKNGKHHIMACPTVLRSKLENLQIKKGDEISVTFLGMKAGKDGKRDYADYDVMAYGIDLNGFENLPF